MQSSASSESSIITAIDRGAIERARRWQSSISFDITNAIAIAMQSIARSTYSHQSISPSASNVLGYLTLPCMNKRLKNVKKQSVTDRCSICLGCSNDVHWQRPKSCMHQFHKSCIRAWLDANKNNVEIHCPMCRTLID